MGLIHRLVSQHMQWILIPVKKKKVPCEATFPDTLSIIMGLRHCLDNEGIESFAVCPINSEECYVKREIMKQIESFEGQDSNQELNISYTFQ